jgi:hypothetical protein
MTKNIRSRSDKEPGQQVEGCTILEKRVVIPPDPRERRLGVYDYLVEVPPEPIKAPRGVAKRSSAAAERGSYTRSTPEEMGGRVIRRLTSR